MSRHRDWFRRAIPRDVLLRDPCYRLVGVGTVSAAPKDILGIWTERFPVPIPWPAIRGAGRLVDVNLFPHNRSALTKLDPILDEFYWYRNTGPRFSVNQLSPD